METFTVTLRRDLSSRTHWIHIFPRKCLSSTVCLQLYEWHPQTVNFRHPWPLHFSYPNASQLTGFSQKCLHLLFFPPDLIQALITSHKLPISRWESCITPVGLSLPLYRIRGLADDLQRPFLFLKVWVSVICIYICKDLFCITLMKLDSDVVISREEVISYKCALHIVAALWYLLSKEMKEFKAKQTNETPIPASNSYILENKIQFVVGWIMTTSKFVHIVIPRT